MKAWVQKELHPHRNEWEETLWPDEVDAARRRARLPRPLLPGGVRRTGRRLLLLAGPRRVHELLGLRRDQHGLRRPDRHGPAPDPPARHRGAEAALPRARDQGREDRLPRDHRAGRRLRRRRHPHDGDPRRRRVRDQRLEDVHHQRPARRLHRPRRRRPTPTRATTGSRCSSSTCGTTRATTSPASASRASSRRWACTPPTPASSRSRTCASRPRTCSARSARASTTSPGSSRASGWSPPPGCVASCRADVRADARVREGARGVRPPDRPVPGDPPQVRRDGDEDRGREADDLRDRLALRQRRVPGPRDHDGEALRVARSATRSPTSASRSSAATAT